MGKINQRLTAHLATAIDVIAIGMTKGEEVLIGEKGEFVLVVEVTCAADAQHALHALVPTLVEMLLRGSGVLLHHMSAFNGNAYLGLLDDVKDLVVGVVGLSHRGRRRTLACCIQWKKRRCS